MLGFILSPPDVPRGGFPLNIAIDFMKGITPLFILGMMYGYAHAPYNALQNPTCWVYLGIHGTYAVLWVFKSWYGFGDVRWRARKPWWYCPIVVTSLALYWLPIYFIIHRGSQGTPLWLYAVCISMFGFGVFFHYVSDMQKTMFLELRARLEKEKVRVNDRLLKDKLWATNRNPNYFGELLIYGSFALLSQHVMPCLWVGTMVTLYWLPSMRLKDKSLSRFGPEFDAYKQQTAFFIPHVW